jgi:inner membrane protein
MTNRGPLTRRGTPTRPGTVPPPDPHVHRGPPSRRAVPADRVRSAAYRLVAVFLLLTSDSLIWQLPVARPAFGVLDEAGHLLTCALVLFAWRGWSGYRPDFAVAAMAASLLIDLDHIPGILFHSDVLTQGTLRPYGHTLLAVLTFAGLGASLAGRERPVPARARRILLGIAAGICLHLVRDMPTGGVPLGWPLTERSFWYPYPVYLLVLAGAALAPAWRPPPTRQTGEGPAPGAPGHP